MATRTNLSPTLDEIEERIEPDLKSAYPTNDLTNEDDFNKAYDDYFEDKTEIKYSARTRQRVFNVHREKRNKEIIQLKKHGITYTKYTMKGKTVSRYRRNGKFISKREVEAYQNKNIV